MINYTMVFSNINIMVFCLHSLPPPIDSGCALSVQPTGFSLTARTGSEWAEKGDLPECWPERWRMAVLSVGVKKEWEGQGTLPIHGTSLAPCLWRAAISFMEKETLMCGFCHFYAHHGGFQAAVMLSWAGARKPQVQHTLQNGARQLQHPRRYLELFPIIFTQVYQQCSSFQ